VKNKIILAVIFAIAFGGGTGFFAGMKFQENKQSTRSPQFGTEIRARNGGQFQGGQNRSGFRPVAGEIIGSDETSITVKLTDGSSKIIFLSEKTEINKAGTAKRDELVSGERVAVFGTENSDGSVTALTIQLNPKFRGPIPNAIPTAQ